MLRLISGWRLESSGQMVDLGLRTRYQSLDRADRVRLLQQARMQILDVARGRPGHPVVARQLASISDLLGESLTSNSQFEKALQLYQETLVFLDRLGPSSSLDSRDLEWRVAVLSSSAGVADRLGKYAESSTFATRCLAGREEQLRRGPSPRAIVSLACARIRAANSLAHCGQIEQAQALITANHHQLENLTSVEVNEPQTVALRVLAQMGLDRSFSSASLARASSETIHNPGPADAVNVLFAPGAEFLVTPKLGGAGRRGSSVMQSARHFPVPGSTCRIPFLRMAHGDCRGTTALPQARRGPSNCRPDGGCGPASRTGTRTSRTHTLC